jgi:hypothetical protein
VYAHGFQHASAILMAHFASRLVDAPKQGLRLRPDKWNDILSGLNVQPPEYIKAPAARKNIPYKHIMDILVCKVIPDFTDSILQSFRTKVGMEIELPMDRDILDFYKRLLEKKELEPGIQALKIELVSLQKKYQKFYIKRRHEQEQNREQVTLSPSSKLKRSFSESERTQMVHP